MIKTILMTTSWLSGLIDAEGCFNIRTRNNNYQHRFFIGNKDELTFYRLLSELYFNNKKVYIRSNEVTLIEISQTIKENLQSNNLQSLIKYLTIHPLKSRKRLAYLYWLKSYNLLLSGRYYTTKRGHTRLHNSIKSLTKFNTKLKVIQVK
jgi:hypothetical protein